MHLSRGLAYASACAFLGASVIAIMLAAPLKFRDGVFTASVMLIVATIACFRAFNSTRTDTRSRATNSRTNATRLLTILIAGIIVGIAVGITVITVPFAVIELWRWSSVGYMEWGSIRATITIAALVGGVAGFAFALVFARFDVRG